MHNREYYSKETYQTYLPFEFVVSTLVIVSVISLVLASSCVSVSGKPNLSSPTSDGTDSCSADTGIWLNSITEHFG